MGLYLEEPPLPEVAAPDFDQSREMLARYIEWVGYLLATMLENAGAREEDDIPYFEPRLSELYAEALYEFLDQEHIQRVARQFREPRFPAGLRQRMFVHGLMGRQLDAKMRFTHFYVLDLRKAARKQAREVLSRMLATVNSLLKSALAAVPGGAAIDEMKQLVENWRFLEDTLDS